MKTVGKVIGIILLLAAFGAAALIWIVQQFGSLAH